MSSDLEKKLRANSTGPERRMWRLLYPFRTGEFHFRKQEQIGPFYVDFVCHHANLIIEVDGDTHYVGGAPERDARRDAFLRGEGYAVLRFTNDDVMHNPEGVHTIIAAALEERPKRRRPALPLPASPTRGEVKRRLRRQTNGSIEPSP